MLRTLCLLALGSVAFAAGDHAESPVRNPIVTYDSKYINQYGRKHEVSYRTLADFKREAAKFKSVWLDPGTKISFTCGDRWSPVGESMQMIPADPLTQILAPMGDAKYEDAIKKVLNSYDVYRSSEPLISMVDGIRGQYYNITNPVNAVITARNPEAFSLNFVCQVVPKGSNEILFKWLEIKFRHVLPIPYGCGSIHPELFANYMAETDGSTRPREATQCAVYTEPGMVVGILCGVDEKIEPRECFRNVYKLTDEDKPTPEYYDPTFEHMNTNSNFRLFRVPKEGISSSVALMCRCVNDLKKTTGMVRIINVKNVECDYVNTPDQVLGKKTRTNSCRREIYPGTNFTLRSAKDGTRVVSPRRHREYSIFVTPSVFDAQLNSTLLPSLLVPRSVDQLNEYFLTTNFLVEHRQDERNQEMKITYAPDAIVVARSEVRTLEYVYHIHNVARRKDKYLAVVTLVVHTTDPYTYGCGAGNNHLFRPERKDFEVEKVTTPHGTHEVTKCSLESQDVTPIGFYCPKDAILDPPDCFESVYLVSNGKTVPITEVAPYARAVRSTNLRILDFVMPSDVHEKEGTRAPESVSCRCLSKAGDLLASISVGIGQRTDADGRPISGEN